jgi:hypothetical protein
VRSEDFWFDAALTHLLAGHPSHPPPCFPAATASAWFLGSESRLGAARLRGPGCRSLSVFKV